MMFRKVSAKEQKFIDMKSKFYKTYIDFESYADSLTFKKGRSKKNSGKARSYARYLIYMAILYEEMTNNYINDLATEQGYRDLEELRHLEEFKNYNRNENGFPNATLNCYQKFLKECNLEGEEIMAYSAETGNKNVDILTDHLFLNRKGSEIVFQNEKLFVLSPSIQNQADWFDIREQNLHKYKESNKYGLLIVRRFEHFLVASLDEFSSHIMKQEYLKTSERGGIHWKLFVDDFAPHYFIYNKDKSNAKFKMIHAERDTLKIEVEKLLKKMVSNKKADLVKDPRENEIQLSIFNSEVIIQSAKQYILSKGFNYSQQNITNLYLSLRAKPFVIISGISGTGKTKIAQLFAESIGATEENGQFMLVPVRPDWSDSSELLGYTDIKGDFMEGQLTKLIYHAIDHPDRPHFLLLDEMNLARVEYYFSDILSVMESRKVEDGKFTSTSLQVTDDVTLHLPGNLYIIGTVNMDETTHPFSKKVLDRANTIEFNEIDLNTFSFLQQQQQIEPLHVANESLQANYIQLPAIYDEHSALVQMVSQQLTAINMILKEIHAQVGYRVRDEICFYMAHNADGDMLLTEDEALDFCYMQKILPRIAGSGLRVEKVLEQLVAFMQTRQLPRSQAKLDEMQRRLKEDEFTSFWIS